MRKQLAALFEVSHSGHRKIRSMEGLRGFAVFLVFLVHYATISEPWVRPDSWTLDALHRLRSIGNAGVDLFFVLSGYLIYGMLMRKPIPLKDYFERRAQRSSAINDVLDSRVWRSGPSRKRIGQ